MVSNIAAGTTRQIHELFGHEAALKDIAAMAESAEWEVRKECR